MGYTCGRTMCGKHCLPCRGVPQLHVMSGFNKTKHARRKTSRPSERLALFCRLSLRASDFAVLGWLYLGSCL